MHTFNLIGGLLILLLCCATYPGKRAEREVDKAGQLVTVEVVKVDCNASDAFRFMHFRFRDKEHSLKVGRQTCHRLKVGQTTRLLHLEKYPDVFLFPNNFSQGEVYAWGTLFILGCYAVISSVQHLRREYAKPS